MHSVSIQQAVLQSEQDTKRPQASQQPTPLSVEVRETFPFPEGKHGEDEEEPLPAGHPSPQPEDLIAVFMDSHLSPPHKQHCFTKAVSKQELPQVCAISTKQFTL